MKFKLLFILFLTFLFGCTFNDSSKSSLNTVFKSKWTGTWKRTSKQEYSTLEIKQINSDSFSFSFFASNGGHTGEIDGYAKINDNSANFKVENCKLNFKLFGDSMVKVKQDGGDCFTGIGVTYSGKYFKSTIQHELNESSLVDLGIFKNKLQDSIFRNLVGKNYQQFINTTQLISEDEDLDGLNTVVISSGVRGLFSFMENIIMINDKNEIWAAVIDNEKVYYFTNITEFKHKIPHTIENWRKNFNDYPIIYQ